MVHFQEVNHTKENTVKLSVSESIACDGNTVHLHSWALKGMCLNKTSKCIVDDIGQDDIYVFLCQMH